jgi:hypothetical protein
MRPLDSLQVKDRVALSILVTPQTTGVAATAITGAANPTKPTNPIDNKHKVNLNMIILPRSVDLDTDL